MDLPENISNGWFKEDVSPTPGGINYSGSDSYYLIEGIKPVGGRVALLQGHPNSAVGYNMHPVLTTNGSWRGLWIK